MTNDDDDDDDNVAALSPVQIVDDIINSILDDIFPAEKAAADVMSVLVDRVMTSVKRRGVYSSSNDWLLSVVVFMIWKMIFAVSDVCNLTTLKLLWKLKVFFTLIIMSMLCLASSRGGGRGRRRRRYVSRTSSDVVPAELTGSVKWTTVKILDSTQPTTDSIFLGADDQVCLSVCLHVAVFLLL